MDPEESASLLLGLGTVDRLSHPFVGHQPRPSPLVVRVEMDRHDGDTSAHIVQSAPRTEEACCSSKGIRFEGGTDLKGKLVKTLENHGPSDRAMDHRVPRQLAVTNPLNMSDVVNRFTVDEEHLGHGHPS
jgi:hypothetical protein